MAESICEPVVMNVANAGTYLGVSADTIRRLIRAGHLPHARIGNSLRLRRSDIDTYLEKQTTTKWFRADGRGRPSAEKLPDE